MQVVVEFFGVPRQLAGLAEATVEVPDDASLREVLVAVRHRFSRLVPSVIAGSEPEVMSPYMLSIDGRRVPPDLGYSMSEGDHVLLLSSLVGGRS